MKQAFAWALVVAAIVATPVVAGQPVKKPACQANKAPPRDAKRPELCRRAPAVPPVIDPTPLFLASTAASPTALSDLS